MRCVNECLMLAVVLALLGACRAEAVEGAEVIKSGDNYKIAAKTEVDAKNPLKGTLVVVIEPTNGWKMDRKMGPAGITFEPPEAVKLTKKAWKKSDAKWEAKGIRIRFEVPYELTSKGEHALKMKFRFVVCTDKLCQMKRFELVYQLGG